MDTPYSVAPTSAGLSYAPVTPYHDSPTHDVDEESSSGQPYITNQNMLDAIVAHYHQSRMWCYRTRASLELAADSAVPAPGQSSSFVAAPPVAPSSDQSGTPSPGEPGQPPLGLDAKPLSLAPTRAPAASTRSLRRKRGFKLKLEGLEATNPAFRHASSENSMAVARPRPALSGSIQLLEMYENVLARRMDNCERLSRLVRESNRGHLKWRS